MKFALITVLTAFSILSSASARANHCDILNPNRIDENGRYCDRSFGVVYDGFKVDTNCYATLDRAIEAMRATSACDRESSRGNCEILFSNRLDSNNRVCKTSFGVTINGHKIDTQCYDTLDKAMDVMDTTKACTAPLSQGGCEILYPNRTDRNGRYCDRSFGVTRDGFKIDTLCYDTVDSALAAMQASIGCQ